MGLDIGPQTVEEFAAIIADAKTDPVERPDGGVRARAVRRGHARGGEAIATGRRVQRGRAAGIQPAGRQARRARRRASITSRPAAAPRWSSWRAGELPGITILED